ncbi:hypothetical protein ACIBQ1_37265 [Nonomuraea sp. NPDC050153]|uniref:hypothetical protein n=1 Tax=Nonomuraea sp. NPDC050153 TaxID=3364359 RepID=UPI00378A0982
MRFRGCGGTAGSPLAWWKGGYLAARQARDGTGRLMTVSGVLELLGFLTGLPRLDR